MCGSFCSRALWVDRILFVAHNAVVDPIFHIAADAGGTEDSLVVSLILREQQWDISFAVQIALTQFRV